MSARPETQTATRYRLFYWALRGRGEQVRLLLNELDETYVDVHVDRVRHLPAMRKEGPAMLYFGSIPMLEDGDFKLAQGPAIMNYLGRKHGIMPRDLQGAAKTEALVLGAEDMRMDYFRTLGNRVEERQAAFLSTAWKERWLVAWDGLLKLNGDSGYLVGPSLTQADVAVWDAINTVVTSIEGADFGSFGRVQRFYERICIRPNIAAYLESGRRLGGTKRFEAKAVRRRNPIPTP